MLILLLISATLLVFAAIANCIDLSSPTMYNIPSLVIFATILPSLSTKSNKSVILASFSTKLLTALLVAVFTVSI